MAQSKPLKMFVPPSAHSVINLCLTFCNPMGCSPPGSLIHGISNKNTREGYHLPSPGDLPDPGIEPMSPALAGRFFTTEPPGNPQDFIFYFHFMYLYLDRQSIHIVQIQMI